MSWIQQIHDTYNHELNIGNEDILPISHKYQKAQLEVTIDQLGNFKSASIVQKDDMQTIIPVTESSGGKTSGIAPNPLNETLPFLAGDYSDYLQVIPTKNSPEDKNKAYMENLEKWVYSDISHNKVKAIYAYLKKNRLLHDLIESGYIELNDDKKLANGKINGKEYNSVFVRFIVLEENETEDKTWRDRTLFKAYEEYYLSQLDNKKDICYITGEEMPIVHNFPSGMLPFASRAKLVSANDTLNFTFRGRFENIDEAMTVGYDSMQKIHNTLVWLANSYGKTVGTKNPKSFVCWCPSKGEVIDVISTENILKSLGIDYDNQEDINVSYSQKLEYALNGFKNKFKESDAIVVMGFEAATKGRLSITYYQELNCLEFIRRLDKWYSKCKWYFGYKIDDTSIYTPNFFNIIKCAYGVERKTDNKAELQVDERMLTSIIEQLLNCMLNGRTIPYTMIQALTAKASNPLSYDKDSGNRNKVLTTACAVINKYQSDKDGKKGDENMKLDNNNNDRSYLYGRLLAIYEKVERQTFDENEKRDTNAIRLQSAFVNHPKQTWDNLEKATNPYFQKLKPGSREYYRNMVTKITTLFKDEDYPRLNDQLNENYLLGYYLQRAELNKGKEE